MDKKEVVQAFIHPEDEQARRKLEAVPGFATAVKAFMRMGWEKLYHGLSMADKIRLGPSQLPDIYQRLQPICARLAIPEPEFYLEMNPVPNADTYGDTRVFLTVTSGLLEYLDQEEVDAVIAHECGHIACRHVLYHTMANLLMQGASFSAFLAPFTKPMELALCYWSRRSELSADRAAAVTMGSAKPVIGTMIRLSGGPKSITGNVDIDAYASQADAYDDLLGSTWDSLLQSIAVMNNSHPFAAVRLREIKNWACGEEFERLKAALAANETAMRCPKCNTIRESSWRFCRQCGAKIN